MDDLLWTSNSKVFRDELVHQLKKVLKVHRVETNNLSYLNMNVKNSRKDGVTLSQEGYITEY